MSEDRAVLLVSFLAGMASGLPRGGFKALSRYSCWSMDGPEAKTCWCVGPFCLCSCSFVDLSPHLRCIFLQQSFWVCQGLRSLLPPVHRSEDRAGRYVLFPEGMISYLPRRKIGMSPCLFRRDLVVMCCTWYCTGRKHEQCRFCSCPCGGCRVCVPCFLPCTDPRTVQANTCSSPKEGSRTCQGESSERRPAISARSWM